MASGKVVVNLATGLEDPERVTVAFLVGTAVLEQGRQVTIVPDQGGSALGLPGHAEAVACDGCPPLPRLVQQYTDGGGELLVCPGSGSPDRREDSDGIGAHPVAFATKATTYPALIPQEVAGSSRPLPAIPATAESERPAHDANPRLSPLSPQAPRPACHAGGRGFESRRSRKKCLQMRKAVLSVSRIRTQVYTDPVLIRPRPYRRKGVAAAETP